MKRIYKKFLLILHRFFNEMEEGKRTTRIGILIGAIIIAAGFYIGLLVWVPGYELLFISLLALVFLAGGFISGIYSSDNVWGGIWNGLLSGIIGAFFIIAYFVSMLIYSLLFFPNGESEGMLLVFGIVLFLGATVLAAAGGGIGTAIKSAFCGTSQPLV
jgi:hypothetical protein